MWLAGGLVAAAAALPAQAVGLTEPSIRTFVAAQERAWNSAAFKAYFNTFTQEAVFVDQTVTPKEVITYGRSTLAQARALSVKTRAPSIERGIIRSVSIAADGQSALVSAAQDIQVMTDGGPRRVCAERVQRLVMRRGKILSNGQTDTIVKCGPGRRTARP